MSNQYLLEIGTEELPPGFMQTAAKEFKDKTASMLEENQIAFTELKSYITPRRIALIIEGLPEKEPDREEVVKGPPARIAFDDSGNLTKAAEGFAKKNGTTADKLAKEDIDGEIHLVFRQTVIGRDIKKVLAEELLNILLNLSGPRFMKWGDLEVRFARPVRWLVSLWNEEHLPITLENIHSGTTSHGHRILSDAPVNIKSPSSYIDQLEKEGFVLVDSGARRKLISAQLKEAGKTHDGEAEENEDLLDLVTMIVEYPTAVVGEFSKDYLNLPEDVVKTVMVAHQKYFPLLDSTGNLKPNFITLANGNPNAVENIKHGNEKVITARLQDAQFFYEEDQKAPLESRLDNLKGITFQKGLGTMADKVSRIETLAEKLADQLDYDASTKTQSKRAAKLAKADLVTGMVFEFTELQGIMGKQYATLEGEDADVASAIFEHYLPRFNGDDVATTKPGIAVSIADKIDTIVAVFSQEKAKLPTGSRDPLGLRRMASGLIQTILENKLDLDGFAFIETVYTTQDFDGRRSLDETRSLIAEFIHQRLRVSLLEQAIRHDIIDAVLSDSTYLKNIRDAVERIHLLKTVVQDEKQFNALYEPANRIGKILKSEYNSNARYGDIKQDLLEDEAEKSLASAMTSIDDSSYEALAKTLADITTQIDDFFENVMVNDKRDDVKQNRQNLLSVLHTHYLQLADFSKLVISGETQTEETPSKG